MRRFTSIILSRFLLHIHEAIDTETPSVRSASDASSRGVSSLGGSLVFAKDEIVMDVSFDSAPEESRGTFELVQTYGDGGEHVSMIEEHESNAEIAYVAC